ncbi:MAG: Hsp70 family protein, partial [Chitinophagaceae bacterium]
GGDDFDRAIVQHWSASLGITKDELSLHKNLLQELRMIAEKAKKYLSSNNSFTGTVAGQEVELTKWELEQLAQTFIEKTIQCCQNALKDAQLTTAGIDEIIMVGGSTRMPLVKKMVTDFFGKHVHDTLNPDEVVALGAAVQADILAGNNKDFLLLDITPLSLGIETMGGLMDVLIPRNSKIPSRAARQYTTQKDGQGQIRISVYQGERDLVKDNRKLAEFSLKGIPGMPAGFPKVEISFLVNADGILVVKAKELRSGVEQSIEVKPQYGLTDEEVERMLLDSITHAREDMQMRSLTEARTEASQLLYMTRQFIEKNSSFITAAELCDTRKGIYDLENLLENGDKDQVQAAIEKLNEISRPFAERLMDQAIAVAMKGKQL